MQLNFENIVIRLATINDVDNLKSLYSQLIEDVSPNPNDMFKALEGIILEEHNNVFIAIHDDKIVASAQLISYKNLIRSPFNKAIIDSVIVHEQYRGAGIGSKLIRVIIDFAKKNKVQKINLTSSYKRYKAYDFYRNLGFRDCGLGFILDL